MAEKDVVKHLLRANLHQKQYVDQVRMSPSSLGNTINACMHHLTLTFSLRMHIDAHMLSVLVLVPCSLVASQEGLRVRH